LYQTFNNTAAGAVKPLAAIGAQLWADGYCPILWQSADTSVAPNSMSYDDFVTSSVVGDKMLAIDEATLTNGQVLPITAGPFAGYPSIRAKQLPTISVVPIYKNVPLQRMRVNKFISPIFDSAAGDPTFLGLALLVRGVASREFRHVLYGATVSEDNYVRIISSFLGCAPSYAGGGYSWNPRVSYAYRGRLDLDNTMKAKLALSGTVTLDPTIDSSSSTALSYSGVVSNNVSFVYDAAPTFATIKTTVYYQQEHVTKDPATGIFRKPIMSNYGYTGRRSPLYEIRTDF